MDREKLVARGNLVFVLKLEASSSVTKLKVDTWRRSESSDDASNETSAGSSNSWTKSKPVEYIFPSALKRDHPRRRILDARAVEGSDGLMRVHILVSSKDSSQLLQIKTSSSTSSSPSSSSFCRAYLVDLGSQPEFQTECRLLDGPSVFALQKDKLLLWIVESKSYAVSSSLSLSRLTGDVSSTSDSMFTQTDDDSKSASISLSRASKSNSRDESKPANTQSKKTTSETSDWRLSAAIRLDESAVFAVVTQSSTASIVVADVFVQNSKRLSPLNSESSTNAIPRVFRRSLTALLVVDCLLVEDEVFESDLFIATTQRRIFRVKNGNVLSYASVATLDLRSSDELAWEFLSRTGGDDDKLVVCNRRSKDVAVFAGETLTTNEDAAAALAIRLAGVDDDDFRLPTYSREGVDEMCVYGLIDGAKNIVDVQLLSSTDDAHASPTPAVGEGTLQALVGFRNVVQTGTAVLERNRRKLNDKVAMVESLLLRLDQNRVSNALDVNEGRKNGLFRLMGSEKEGETKGADESGRNRTGGRTCRASVTPVSQFSAKNRIVVTFKVEGELEEKELFVLGKNSGAGSPFRCKVNLSETRNASTSHLSIIIHDPIAYGPTIDFSLLQGFCRLASCKIDVTTLKPLELSKAKPLMGRIKTELSRGKSEPELTHSKPDALFLALNSAKIGVSLVLLSADVDLPANHYLLEDRMKFEAEESEDAQLFSMKDASSLLFGCFVSAAGGGGGECSLRESRFRLFADSLSQVSLFAQNVYEATPPNCLLMSQERFQRRFRSQRAAEELTTLLRDCIEEKRRLYRDFVKSSFNSDDERDRSRGSLLTSLKGKRRTSVNDDNTTKATTATRSVAEFDRRNSELSSLCHSRLHCRVAALDST